MITILGRTETTIVIKKSRFIGLACHVDDETQAKEVIDARRKEHYDARHNCFAYVLDDGVMRYSDDGEPQGTAGLPMLDVIRKNGLENVLVVCTRYFGGILLGAGGLVRAYTQSAADTLAAAPKAERVPCRVYACAFSYTDWARAEKTLGDAGYILDNTDFAADVSATFCVLGSEDDAFAAHVTQLTLGRTTPVLLGEKYIEHIIGT
jgi:uncharacterized YigZ family protein